MFWLVAGIKCNKFVQQIGLLTVVGVVKAKSHCSSEIGPNSLDRAISCTGKLSYFQSSGRQLTSLSTKSRPSEKTDFVRITHRGRCGGTRVQQGGSERSKSSWSCHFPRDNTSTSNHLTSPLLLCQGGEKQHLLPSQLLSLV